MSDSPFRDAVEARSLDLLSAALAPDVIFRSPAVHAPYEGRDLVLVILGAVLEVFEDFAYQGEIRDGDNEMLRFKARVGDRDVDGVDIVTYADGLVTELTVMIRPFSALQAVREAMAAKLEAYK
jgi:hypothetical protein